MVSRGNLRLQLVAEAFPRAGPPVGKVADTRPRAQARQLLTLVMRPYQQQVQNGKKGELPWVPVERSTPMAER